MDGNKDNGSNNEKGASVDPQRHLRFGVFMAPFHPCGVNPTAALRNDLYLTEQLDRLGYDEVWFGEHHSAGTEIIAAPELCVAAAAERTKHIKLGTGVISVGYHHPFMVAQRAVQLDHMTRGRLILGLGGGGLPSDAVMLGLDTTQTRGLLEDGVDIITRLLRSDEPVNFQNDRWTLKDARLHVRPYSRPHMEIAIAAVVSPSGPRLAARYGHSLLSVGATSKGGFDALGMHWDVMEERSAHFGTQINRSDWRLHVPMHIAETREQAYADVAYGIKDFFDYTNNTAAFTAGERSPHAILKKSGNPSYLADLVNESGYGTIGTVEDAINHIEKMWNQSKGFGCLLLFAQNWANPAATLRSYELISNFVMPYFQGHYQAGIKIRDHARAIRDSLLPNIEKGVEQARQRYEAEKQAR